MVKKYFITKQLRESISSSESAKMYMITCIKTGKTEIVINKTYSKRMPIQDLEKAELLYERLTGGGGRRVYTLDELADEKITK